MGKISWYKNPCTSRILIFEDASGIGKKAIVIPQNPHNHLCHPHAKPTLEEKQLLDKCALASRKARVTPRDLRTNSTTAEILGGKTWEKAIPSMIDNQRLQKWVRNLKNSKYPKGLNWNGQCTNHIFLLHFLTVQH